MGLSKKIIAQQRQEIKLLQAVEDNVSALQNSKLLQRVASDIHDTALQDIKVLMDQLELEFCNLDSDYILKRLEFISYQIREQLNFMRQMSQTIDISPILSSGLDVGIRAHVKELVNSGRLSLSIIDELQSIDEPVTDNNWLNAREDIYRFWREVINNVMLHAQPPHGNATQVTISLERQQNRCYFTVADNNLLKPSNLANNGLKSQYLGGYGTKIMETIASGLPGGIWQRAIANEGGVVVELSWIL